MTRKGRPKAVELPAFVELPNGLFTASGIWFHTTVADLRDFASEVLDRVELEQLLKAAAAWLRSPGTLSLWLVLFALAVRPPWTAALAGVVGFAGWSILGPGVVFRPVVRMASVLQHPLLVGGAYVAVLSWLGSGGATVAVGVGLIWFVAVRWGLVERLVGPVVLPIRDRLYRLEPADQILRALIIRHALALRVSVGEIGQMEERMMKIANRHRNR